MFINQSASHIYKNFRPLQRFYQTPNHEPSQTHLLTSSRLNSNRLPRRRKPKLTIPFRNPRPLSSSSSSSTRRPSRRRRSTQNTPLRTRPRALRPQTRRLLPLTHLQGLTHTPQKIPLPAANVHDPADLHQPPHFGALARDAAEIHARAALDVRLDDFEQHLARCWVESSDAVDVEDEVAVVLV
jgi:hypothetical protein